MNLTAFYNHGRWLVTCPRCWNVLEMIDSDATVQCVACWPNLRAVKYEPDRFGALVAVPHTELIAETQQAVVDAGEEYGVEYPADKTRIEEVLRVREIINMNWYPGETVADLAAENSEHGLETPE